MIGADSYSSRCVLCCVLVLFALPAVARADAEANFNQLKKRYDEQYNAGKYREAEQTSVELCRLAEEKLPDKPTWFATALNCRASICQQLGRYAEAESLFKRALAIWEKALGPDHQDVATNLNNLAVLYQHQGRYAEAEPLFKRALAIRERTLGVEHPAVAQSRNNLAGLYYNQGRYAEAEPLFKRSLAIREKALGPDHPDVSNSLNNLARLYVSQGRYAEAEPLYKRSLAISEKALGPDHPLVATSLDNLAGLYRDQGRCAEAEPLHKRAMAIREKALGPDHPDVATNLNGLALLYNYQGRYAEAEPLYNRALAISEKALGPDHPDVAQSLNNLAVLYQHQGRYAEAEPLHKRALAIWEKVLGPDHPDVATSLNNLAALYSNQGRYAEAEPLYKRALAIWEKALGPNHPYVAQSLSNLAQLYYWQGKSDEAEPLVDRAVGILDRAGAAPGIRFGHYILRARIAWKEQLRGEAVADLHQAMQLAEQQRSQSSGAAHERAESFASYSNAFEQMLAWQLEIKDMNEALSAMERGRARSLLDEMSQAGADLLAGRPALEREALRKQELDLKERADRLQKQLDALDASKEASAEEQAAKRTQLQAELAKVRDALYDHYRDVRGSSPVYRQLLSTGSGPPRLSQIQRRLGADDSLLLVYLLGDEGGYVLTLTADKAELSPLTVEASAAKILETDPGPLTAKRLGPALINQKGTGVVQQLRDPKTAGGVVEKLAVLWQVLVPEAHRDALTAGKIKQLIVVPDGKLALLPFETLVVERGENPKYLLDAGPPILYSPSAAVFYNLADRAAAAIPAGRAPVLTVGNPDYGTKPTQLAARGPSILNELGAGARYNAAGGKLAPLPYSGTESQWVAEVFAKQGLQAVRLEGAQATKANLKAQIENRRVIHLACHGFADQSYGNFYGALALTPGGKPNDTADDGFLTLPEIYDLNLKGCELAILSACETNFGPQQRGEGVWAISRGFLVAGARRVVASNWLVDDEAAASLVSYFCSGLANAQKEGKQPDYAQALYDAKRWVRQQKKWESPYYWGTFVLVGPN